MSVMIVRYAATWNQMFCKSFFFTTNLQPAPIAIVYRGRSNTILFPVFSLDVHYGRSCTEILCRYKRYQLATFRSEWQNA